VNLDPRACQVLPDRRVNPDPKVLPALRARQAPWVPRVLRDRREYRARPAFASMIPPEN